MPDIDMKPDDYRVRGKDGRWFRRDDKRYLVVGLLMSGLILGAAYWYRNALAVDPTVFFGLTAIGGICAGIFLGNLLKDIY
jgi:hypothetical protein